MRVSGIPSSKSIAALVGPTLLAVSASEALNLRIWSAAGAPIVHLNGCLLFVAGLSIIREHNVWSLRWPVALTDGSLWRSGCIACFFQGRRREAQTW